MSRTIVEQLDAAARAASGSVFAAAIQRVFTPPAIEHRVTVTTVVSTTVYVDAATSEEAAAKAIQAVDDDNLDPGDWEYHSGSYEAEVHE